VRLHLKLFENVKHLLETSVVDSFRKAALFIALFWSNVLADKIILLKGLKQMLC
jgi:hypothetical protein